MLLSSNTRFHGSLPAPNTVFVVNQADWLQRGEFDFELMGFSLAVTPRGMGMESPMLIVGAPGYLQSAYATINIRQYYLYISFFDLKPSSHYFFLHELPIFSLLDCF